MIDAALSYAGRGWPIFPCRPLDETEEEFHARKQANPNVIKRFKAKSPLIAGGCHSASADPETIRQWWTRWPGAMIGLATGQRSGVLVLDVDLPDGEATLAALEAEHGPLPLTVEQRTGSGGRQLFFKYPQDGKLYSVSAGKLGKKLDTRGEHGYVIIPPSTHPSGGTYAWVKTPKQGTPFADAPAWLLEKIAKAPENKAQDTAKPVVELDQGQHIMEAVAWLMDDAPMAIEGQAGDVETFRVAARLRDLGISESMALELMARCWNPRCMPPWDPDDLAVKVRNGYAYAHEKAPGAGTAEAAFDSAYVPPNDEPNTQGPLTQIVSLEDLANRDIPKVRFAVPGFLPEGLAVLAGNPKVRKSWMALDIILTMAAGETVLGKFPTSGGKALYLALEDSQGRLKDRQDHIVSAQPGLMAMRKNVYAVTDWPRMDKDGLEWLDKYAENTSDLKIIVIDTLVKLRPIKRPKGLNAYEIDSIHLGQIKKLADRRHLAIIVITHLNKSVQGNDPFDRITGSNGIFGVADTAMLLIGERGSDQAELKITGRDIESQDYAIEWSDFTCTWRIAGQALDVRLTGERQDIIDVLAEAAEPLKPAAVASALGKPSANVTSLMRKLFKLGVLESPAYGLYTLKKTD